MGSISGAIAGGVSGGLNPTKCFIAGTLVATILGTVAIETIEPGMYVYAQEESTGQTAAKEVVNTFENEIDQLVAISFEEETIYATPGHPFYVEGEGCRDVSFFL